MKLICQSSVKEKSMRYILNSMKVILVDNVKYRVHPIDNLYAESEDRKNHSHRKTSTA